MESYIFPVAIGDTATAQNGADRPNTPPTYTPAAYGGNSVQFEELPAGDEPLPF